MRCKCQFTNVEILICGCHIAENFSRKQCTPTCKIQHKNVVNGGKALKFVQKVKNEQKFTRTCQNVQQLSTVLILECFEFFFIFFFKFHFCELFDLLHLFYKLQVLHPLLSLHLQIIKK